MDIVYGQKGLFSKENGKTSFLLTSNKSWLSLGVPNTSAYQGWVILQDSEPHKIIDSINFDRKADKLIINKNSATINRGSSSETYRITENSIQVSIRGYEGKVRIDFDCRHVHDFRDTGRNYTTEIDAHKAIIHYTKYEDQTNTIREYERWIAIHGLSQLHAIEKWDKRTYPYDASRNIKNEFYVYEAIEGRVFDSAEIVICYGSSREEAVRKLSEHKINTQISQSDENAEQIAIQSLRQLTIIHPVRHEGHAIIAGIPWFTQVWSRDELVSVGGYIANREYHLAKEILQRYTKNMKDGVLPNRDPPSELASADSTGWLCLRWHQLVKKLQAEKILSEYITNSELETLSEQLESVAENIIKKTENKLIENGPLETWMDTSDSSWQDKRDGARIEIQALALASLEAVRYVRMMLAKNTKDIDECIHSYRERVRNAFFHDGILSDGSADATQRPNIFIAYYAYPALLSKEQWIASFENALKELWLSWGGLASISTKSDLFQNEHTGIDNRSYHRGDSWYWINNIAAMCLREVDSQKFSKYIDEIQNASIKEMLYSGFAGHCAEISSAKELTSKGCLAQAWSAGTLVELLKKTN